MTYLDPTAVPATAMKELIKGANAPLASAGKLRLRLCWNHAPGDLDLACFALDAQERVLSDDWFLFYNQPASPRGAIRFDLARAEFLIQLDSLPDEIHKCVFTATLGQGHFGCLLYTSPSPRDQRGSRMPSSA